MLNALLLALMLTAQPANADTVRASKAEYISSTGAAYGSYESARNVTDGTGSGSVYENQLIGQHYSPSAHTYTIYRTFLSFAVPAGITADACKLNVYCGLSEVETDFSIFLVSAPTAGPDLTTADFSHFTGWLSSGSYSTTSLMATYYGSSMVEDTWSSIALTSAGKDTVLAHAGGTVWFMLLSGQDRASVIPDTTQTNLYEEVGILGAPVSGSEMYEPYLSGITRNTTSSSRNIPYSLTPTPLYDKSPVPLYRGY